MQRLSERYRPQAWADFIGQDKAVGMLRGWCALAGRTGCPGAFLFEGPSGAGKTSAAWCVARTLGADPGMDVHAIDAANLSSVNDFRGLEERLSYSAWGSSGWRVVIIDEAHRLSKAARELFLGLLERLPEKRAVIFTTTEPAAFDLIFQSRVKTVHFVKPRADLITAHVQRVALESAGVMLTDNEALKLVRECQNNLRACLEELEMQTAEALLASADEAEPQRAVA